MRLAPAALLVFLALSGALQSADLDADARKMLQDAAGWEYISLSDSQDGFPTQHTCFDGQQTHEEECSGKLTLASDLHFAQVTRIKGQSVQRTGHYELSGDQLSFFDEFETKDGPYTVVVDINAKTMKMSMPQVNIELLLEKEYRQLKRKAGGQ